MNNNGYTEISTIQPTATFVANINKRSQPKGKNEGIQAISDNLRYLIADYQMQLKAEKWGLDFIVAEHTLGKGGEQFQDDFSKNYQKSIDKNEVAKKPKKAEKGEDVILRKVSRTKPYDNVSIGNKAAPKKGSRSGGTVS